MNQSDAPGVAERYSTAITSSNLKVEADKGGAADLLIAAGWSPSRIGAALLRLQSEWDSSEHPKQPTLAQAQSVAALLVNKYAGERPDVHRAKKLLQEWYFHESRIVMGKLKTLPYVREAVTAQAARWRMAEPESIAAMVILHWLTPQCVACGGRGDKQIAETPALAGKPCKPCNGSGVASCPGGADGRKLANLLDNAVSEAKSSIGRRQRAMQ